ncbi:cysteine hydrolase family protein [Lachnoclostridium sp. An181]|uniref:cysteine hydrolase family protein n=1 Tax=Lachnoclostridium sp. An181 TaxID=1965575 RepID=UPI000B39FA26|nr:isochorismatase family cysteine hydrolase [Lachnoclostridium sp. An181]OUP51338.1 amidase [Lachnoclostridium sp. An181]
MKEKLLIVVDMQNDFVTGALGTKEAKDIVRNVKSVIEKRKEEGWSVVFTMDTHGEDYAETMEGRKLPVRHCIRGTDGWEIIPELVQFLKDAKTIQKPTFGSVDLVKYVAENKISEIELIGVCTDICVVSNALLLKAHFPEKKILVDASACAGVTREKHMAALETMSSCHIDILNK